MQLRSGMSARDQALVDALEPYVMRQPSDYAEFERRIVAAAARFPRDAELAYLVARAKTQRAPLAEQIAQLEEVIALDARFNLARVALAELQLYQGELDAAAKTIDACLRDVPSAAQCAVLRGDMHQHLGDCAAVEADARQLVALDPSAAGGYQMLASALYGVGRAQAARTALQQSWQRPDVLRGDAEFEDRIALQTLDGDFVSARANADALAARSATQRERGVHARVARLRIWLLEEIGDTGEAARLAREYLDHKDGWLADPRREDFAVARDPTPAMVRVALRGKTITRAEAEREREAWLRGWNATVLSGWRSFVWMYGFAEQAVTKEDAAAAVAALPGYEPLAPFRPLSLVGAEVGRVLLGAGRVDEARRWLEAAARSCRAVDFPILHTRAHLWLGEANERAGDKSGACAAYAVVLQRWGKAVPRSVSAEAARARRAALRC
jgi:serine/threonine-protein kinase